MGMGNQKPGLSGVSMRRNRTHGPLFTEQEEARWIMAAASWFREVVTAVNTGMRRERFCPHMGRGRLTRRTVTVFKSKNGERRTRFRSINRFLPNTSRAVGHGELRMPSVFSRKPVPS